MLNNTLRLNFCYIKKLFTFLIHVIIQKIIVYILKIKQKKKCLFSWDYMINHNDNEDENEK